MSPCELVDPRNVQLHDKSMHHFLLNKTYLSNTKFNEQLVLSWGERCIKVSNFPKLTKIPQNLAKPLAVVIIF